MFRKALPRAALALLLIGAPASCDDEPQAGPPASPDGGTQPPPADAGSPGDASSNDAPYDAAMRGVTCTVTPCARDLSASWSESFCALLDDGRVACWGRNEGRELGRDGAPWSAKAAAVDGVTGAVALDRTCAVVENGRVVCWGPSAPAESDAGVATIPVARARSIRIGRDVGCAVLDDGSVSCWGTSGADGVLAFADAGGAGSSVPPSKAPIDGAVDELAIVHGQRATCSYCPPVPVNAIVARRTDGTLLSWGVTPLIGRATGRAPDPEPARIPLDHGDHVFGGFGGCATHRGSLRCWADRVDAPSEPQPMAGLPNVAQVALGDYYASKSRFGRGCAVSATGSVHCWGDNDYGQAGDGTTVLRAEPVGVQGLPEPIVRVEVTRGATCALGVSGRVHCWGDDAFGQRGQKTPFTRTPAPLPVELP